MASGSDAEELPDDCTPPWKVPRRLPSGVITHRTVEEQAAEKAAADDATSQARKSIGAESTSGAEAHIVIDELVGIEAAFELSNTIWNDAWKRLLDLKRRQQDAAARARRQSASRSASPSRGRSLRIREASVVVTASQAIKYCSLSALGQGKKKGSKTELQTLFQISCIARQSGSWDMSLRWSRLVVR